MIDKNLISHIQQSFNKGYDAKYTYNYLIKKGYFPKNVSDTINYVQNMHKRISIQTIPSQGYPKLQESSKKRGIFIGIFIVVLVIALFVFLFIRFSSNTLSSDELSAGTYTNLKEDKEMKFEINKEEHKIIIDSIYDDSVDIIIESKTIEVNLKIGETKKFDLDNDGIYDLRIRLVSIEDNKPYIYIKEISEVICTEDWNCTEWSDCVGETKTRTCTDLNNCGTIENKPAEIQYCIVEATNFTENISNFNCSEQSGTICNQTEICNGTIINASDSERCCVGNCEANQSLGNQDECSIDKDCDDGYLSTKDICSGTPKKCSHNTITECITGDNYCPENCDYLDDEDCELTDPIKIECGDNIWCYHDKVVETNNYTLCFNINNYWNDEDQGVVGYCIENIANNLNDCSLCEYIVKQDIHNACVREVC